MNGTVRRIWGIYSFIWIISIGVLGAIGMATWHTVIDKKLLEQQASIELFASGVTGILESQHLVLTLLGEQISAQMPLTNDVIEETNNKLDALLKKNPSIFAFGFILPNGHLVIGTSNITKSKVKNAYPANFLTHSATKDSFQQTLQTTSITLGRTYYLPAVQELVIPVRKSVYSDEGQLLGVMSAGISVKDSQLFEHHYSNSYQPIGIARSDGYWQYHSQYSNIEDKQTAHDFFQQPIPERYFANLLATLYNNDLTSVEVIDSEPPKYLYRSTYNPQHTQFAVAYDPRFDHWYVSYVSLSHIQALFIKRFLPYILGFFGLHIVVYLLFRYLSHSQQQRETSLIDLASHDPLTDLPNRKFVREQFSNWVNIHQSFSLLYIDLDHFKKVNDTFGHEAGDKVLKELCARVCAIIDDKEILTREAGDEFILMSPYVEKNYLEKIANRINASLARPFKLGDTQVVLGCSIGISSYPTHGVSSSELLKAADKAMYLAKKTRNSYCFFNRSLDEETQYTFRIEQRLRQAIEHAQLRVKYQPQVDKSLQLTGIEALLRWEDEELGNVSPTLFINIAEKVGLIRELSQYLFGVLMAEIDEFSPALKQATLSINISVSHFMMSCFIDDLQPLITKTREHGIALTLEITESLLINDISMARKRIAALHALDVKISLDDFGTGYSSLSILKDLPIDEIKIDRSFVLGVDSDPNAIGMIKNIVAIGKNFDKTVVAEGVETATHWRKLTHCGCDLFQGWFVSKPLSRCEANAFAVHQHTIIKQNTVTAPSSA